MLDKIPSQTAMTKLPGQPMGRFGENSVRLLVKNMKWNNEENSPYIMQFLENELRAGANFE